MAENEKILYDDGTHKCVMFAFDDESHEDAYLSVNQYLIVQNGAGVLIDPGSEAIFDELYDAVSRHVEIENIKFIFFSHQDPDVSGSISQWAVSTKAKFIMPSIWIRFMSHYGFTEMSRVVSLADHGAKLKFGNEYLKFVPAHFLHSPGNFSLYDSKSKIVFSGDIGAAVVPSPTDYKHVKDFDSHIEALHGFHKRYMGSNKLCRAWVSKIEQLDVDMIAPQHGLIFEDEKTGQFLEWLKELKCGSDYMDELY
ncbi:MAG: MBL fold metallo-hydrolase [Sulfurimonas sp.]|nr:MBL fold metallo-hydrolase [Sulfurimonas sp.]